MSDPQESVESTMSKALSASSQESRSWSLKYQHGDALSKNFLRFMVREAGICASSILLLTLFSQIQIPLPFTPVPLTLGPQGPIVVGALSSPWRSLGSTALYVILGFLGLPLFAGFESGWCVTGGYLMGYVFSALLASVLFYPLMNRSSKPPSSFQADLSGSPLVRFGLAYFAALISLVPTYFLGVAVLKVALNTTLSQALSMGAYPFLLVALTLKLPLLAFSFVQAKAVVPPRALLWLFGHERS